MKMERMDTVKPGVYPTWHLLLATGLCVARMNEDGKVIDTVNVSNYFLRSRTT